MIGRLTQVFQTRVDVHCNCRGWKVCVFFSGISMNFCKSLQSRLCSYYDYLFWLQLARKSRKIDGLGGVANHGLSTVKFGRSTQKFSLSTVSSRSVTVTLCPYQGKTQGKSSHNTWPSWALCRFQATNFSL